MPPLWSGAAAHGAPRYDRGATTPLRRSASASLTMDFLIDLIASVFEGGLASGKWWVLVVVILATVVLAFFVANTF